jgi:Fe-S cluster assembly protein SufD
LTTLAERPVREFPLPTGREEAWRFTPLKRLKDVIRDELPAGGLVLRLEAPTGVGVELAESGLGTGAYQPVDRAAQQVWRGHSKAFDLNIAEDAIFDEPVTFNVGATGGMAFGHLRINVGRHAKLTLVLNFDATAQGGMNLQLNMSQGSNLTLVQVHDQARTNVWVSDQELSLGRDSSLLSLVVVLGGDLIRLTPSVRFADEGARAEMLGLYLTGADQHHENRVLIDHATPRCVSDVLYNGALYGSGARSVWVGDVVVRAAAEGIDTYEKNQNLLLVDDARADSIPNLELETGEVVRAGHASTTGKLDEEQVFYLMARGVTELEARALIVRGLFAAVLQRIDDEGIADLVMQRLDDAFATAGSASGVLRGNSDG